MGRLGELGPVQNECSMYVELDCPTLAIGYLLNPLQPLQRIITHAFQKSLDIWTPCQLLSYRQAGSSLYGTWHGRCTRCITTGMQPDGILSFQTRITLHSQKCGDREANMAPPKLSRFLLVYLGHAIVVNSSICYQSALSACMRIGQDLDIIRTCR